VDGAPITSWDQLSTLIQDAPGKALSITVDRAGQSIPLTVTPELSQKRVADASGNLTTIEAGVIGISPGEMYVRQSPATVLPMTGRALQQITGVVLDLPSRMVQVWNAAFSSAPRDPTGPVGLIGVGRFAGDTAANTSLPVLDRLSWLLNILATLNLSLFVFNLIPLLPLDGGHVLGALWEWVKRGFFAVFRRGAKAKPVDMAKLMPLTAVVVTVLIAMELLLAYADLVKPVTAG
jgi:membrane-associated protease RseP (regulator of RpoE activity)